MSTKKPGSEPVITTNSAGKYYEFNTKATLDQVIRGLRARFPKDVEIDDVSFPGRKIKVIRAIENQEWEGLIESLEAAFPAPHGLIVGDYYGGDHIDVIESLGGTLQ